MFGEMPLTSWSSRRRRAVALLLLTVQVGGCFRYQAVGRLRDGDNLPPHSRVTTFDGRTVVLASSRMVSDTIRGFELGRSQRVDIPLAYVDQIETKRFDKKESVIAAGITLVLFWAITEVLAISEPIRSRGAFAP